MLPPLPLPLTLARGKLTVKPPLDKRRNRHHVSRVFGAILAVSAAVCALVFALIVRDDPWKRADTPLARKRHEADFVTREELELAIEKATRDLEYMANDWYEKFNALHQRLAKREKRAAAPDSPPELELVGRPAPPSVRAHYINGSK